MTKLNQQISELEKYSLAADVTNENESLGSTFWHVAHSLLLISQVFESLPLSNPKEYTYKFAIYKTIVFLTKKIPKGKVKAPRIVRPEKQDIETITKQFTLVKEYLKNLKNIDKNKFFTHPFFGDIKKDDAITFLEIHTEHHLKIIRAINT